MQELGQIEWYGSKVCKVYVAVSAEVTDDW